MNNFGTANWYVSLPDEWEGQHDPECSSIYNPDGVGALQISAAIKDTTVTEEDLNTFASDYIEVTTNTKKIIVGNFAGFSSEYTVKNEYWQQWFLKSGRILMFVTYNCTLEDKGVENNNINLILESLKAI